MDSTPAGIDRRTAITLGALTALGAVVASGGASSAAGAPPSPAAGASDPSRMRQIQAALPAPVIPSSWQVKPCALSQVSLTSSVFTTKRDRMLAYARAYPADRILANFRTEARLSTNGAEPPGSWDDATGLLRGHYSGHFLSLIAQAYAGTGEPALKSKLDLLVAELGKCQQAMAASGRYSHPGYLAAYPEDQFVQLENYATYPSIWAPWYTCHKILAGLLDCYRLGGNEQALQIAVEMGRWAYSRLSRTTDAQRQRMWALYIAGEYGGMNESLAELATLSGDETLFTAATYFDNTALLTACAENRDILDGKHANQHIPQFLGYLKEFDATGDVTYRTAVENFWTMVVPHRMFTHGGTGQGEIFRARDGIAKSINGTTNAETCACYNMLKLARQLFFMTGKAEYMDYYERGLYNQILGSRKDVDSTTDPMVTYMLPVGPGSVRGFGNIGTCCGGTGLENHTKYQDTIYFRSIDEQTLYVNLYIPAVLDWHERNLTVTQTTTFPDEGSSRLTITGSGTLTLKLRVPHWVRAGFRVSVNGVAQNLTAAPGTYVAISRSWSSGDVVDISMPFSLRVERAIDDPTVQSVLNGPIALVARSSSATYRPVSLYGRTSLSGSFAAAMVPQSTANFFTGNGMTWAPLYVGTDDPYHLYVRRSEPKVVFGGLDAGVTNPLDEQKLSFLDRVWDQAPFRDRSAFLDAVATTSSSFVQQGLMTRRDRQAVLLTASRARVSA